MIICIKSTPTKQKKPVSFQDSFVQRFADKIRNVAATDHTDEKLVLRNKKYEKYQTKHRWN